MSLRPAAGQPEMSQIEARSTNSSSNHSRLPSRAAIALVTRRMAARAVVPHTAPTTLSPVGVVDGDHGQTACSKMNLRRGFLRLAISSALLWLVFWTSAYILTPYSSMRPEPASFWIRVTATGVLVPCLVAAVILGCWIAAGLRSS